MDSVKLSARIAGPCLLLFAQLVLSEPAVQSLESAQRLPEPLTLEFALSLADENHPALALRRAELTRSRALQKAVEAEYGWNAELEARLRAVDPSYKATNSTNNDSSVKLRLHKRLYDFGRTEAAQQAADADYRSQEWHYLDARQQHRLDILRNYFDVLLADLQYIRDNESMTMGFLHWDKAKERSEMGQLSDIEVLEKESIFQQRRRAWQQSQNLQRASRQRLAISLNRPTQLSSTLAEPALSLKRELPDVETLTERALEENPMLKAQRAQVNAAQARVESARSSDAPVVYAEIQAAVYNRTTSTRDPFSAGLLIEVPLFKSGRNAELAKGRADLHHYQALLSEAELDIRQAVLDLWLEIKGLQAQQEEMRALGAYRDLYIDRSRALYELEVKSDLGDAETRISDYRLQKAATDYELAMAWARLDALLGRLITPEARAEEGEG
ncbi:MAG: TolC family protein [Chromatiales bacterium]|nr:TolC family protein [Chromatiales bacterium]